MFSAATLERREGQRPYWIRVELVQKPAYFTNFSRVDAPCFDAAATARYAHEMTELVFEVTQEADGGFVAESLGEGVITQADTWDELRRNVREAVKAYFFDSAPPKHIRLHLVRDEILANG